MFNNIWKSDILVYVIIVFVLLICLKVYSESDVYNLKCIVSTVDGNKYCVREREKINDAANLLARVTEKCKALIVYLKEKHSNDDDVKRLIDGFNPKKISETRRTKYGKKVSQYTKEGQFIASFDSIVEASEKTNVTRRNVQECVSGRNKTAGGFIWKYEEPKDAPVIEEQNQAGSQ